MLSSSTKPYYCDLCGDIHQHCRACEQQVSCPNQWVMYEFEVYPKEFGSEDAAHQHMPATGYWATEFPCEICDLTFDTEEEATHHMTLNRHYERYCGTCDRSFSTAGCLQSVRTQALISD